jgi:uncharacterized small protein (DUF1192 family)
VSVVAQNASTELVTRLRKGADFEWDTVAMQEAADTITRLTAEVERLTGERDRQYDYNAELIAKYAALEAEVERKDAALLSIMGCTIAQTYQQAWAWCRHTAAEAYGQQEKKV